EFVGDSITCGYGNEAKGSDETFDPETENAYLTYASLCARKCFCECATICYSGKGIMRDYSGNTFEPMTELYGRVYPQKKARFATERPADLAVINLGTNDFATGAPDEERFVAGYVNLISQIRRNSPHAPIVILDGPVMNNDWPFKGALDLFRKYRERIIDRCERDGLGPVMPFPLSTQGDLGFGADFHPSTAQHEKNADELARFISEKNLLKKERAD
ncbi:MAG TPA: SGNH/GDSL hydrolase family protein, partial [Spirochaetota bacterium]|nr:SGNH/GDSL hydrolase family protein [Spirochaetota bacterium]